ncbi:MAG: T9SS C-terminal target domain-containing protein, partial [Calditrichaeota bacterium]
PQNYQYTVNISANGNSILSNITFSNESRVDRCATTNSFVPGSNELSLSYSANIESAYMFLDYFELKFNRPLIAENDKLKIFYKVGTTPLEFQVSGLPSGENRVWDVSDFANIEAIQPLENGSTVRFHAQETQTTPKIYYVFSPSAALPISDIQRIPNHANLRDPNRKGKLLIITPREFYDTAEQFEILKETQVPRPVETERVILDEIYVEFSSGVPDPTAIRDFIKYAYNNWGQSDIDRFRPEYVWLLGDGSYDYRNIELTNYRNWIPVYEINGNDDIFSRVSDNFFTAINNTKNNNSDLNPVLSVGRLPANSQEEVEHYLQKMITYSQSYLGNTIDKGWQSILTFVADDECAGSGGCGECFHLRQTEDIITRVPSKFDLKKIYLTDFPTEAGGLGRTKPQAAEALLNAINRGTLLINFFGHGDPNTWAHEQVLNKGRDLPRIHNEGKLPLWIAATCTWGKYDNPNIPSMAEAVIWSADKGGIGVIAASRAVFAFQNERFVDKLIQYLFPQKSDTAHSEIIGNAMLRALGGGSNDQKYHLLGDPSLRLADPEHMVQITNISSDTLKALSTATITAQITNTDGTPLTSFNGKAVIRVFDAVDSLNKCSRNYVYAGGSIFRGVVTVENGQLQSSFIIPKSIKYKNSRTGRVSIYAWSEDTRDAVGYVDTLLFLGSTTAVNDVEGPQIDFTFEGQPDFFDGDFVPQQPNLVVRLEDQSGINLTGEVGHRIELIIDGRIKKDVTEFFVYDENSYQSGELRYTLPALSSGQHQLIISAWDNLNNYSEARINFNTASASELTLAQVVNYPNPFSDNTYFTFQFQSPNGSAEVTIKIYTVNGRLIRELESFAQPGFNKVFWDGTDRDGNLVANGVYLYKIVVDDGENTLEKIEKLAIVR